MGALMSAYKSRGKMSSFGAGSFNPSPMQANPQVWREQQNNYWNQVLARENEERNRKLQELEEQIMQYEAKMESKRFNAVDELNYKRLLNQYNSTLNPGRGITKVIERES